MPKKPTMTYYDDIDGAVRVDGHEIGSDRPPDVPTKRIRWSARETVGIVNPNGDFGTPFGVDLGEVSRASEMLVRTEDGKITIVREDTTEE